MFLVSITLSWIFGQNPGQSEIQDNVKYSNQNDNSQTDKTDPDKDKDKDKKKEKISCCIIYQQ